VNAARDDEIKVSLYLKLLINAFVFLRLCNTIFFCTIHPFSSDLQKLQVAACKQCMPRFSEKLVYVEQLFILYVNEENVFLAAACPPCYPTNSVNQNVKGNS